MFKNLLRAYLKLVVEKLEECHALQLNTIDSLLNKMYNLVKKKRLMS